VSQFRKKPVVIDAVHWNGENTGEVWDLAEKGAAKREKPTHLSINSGLVHIETLEGTMTAGAGDWIICGVKGEMYPCKPDIFEATYEPA
jgi:hypothetical protein